VSRARAGPLLSLVAAVAVTGTLAGCGAPGGAGEDPAAEPPGPEWIEAPGAAWDEEAEPLVLYVTGSAVIAGDRSAAERVARADALAAIGAFLDGAVAQMGAAAAPPASVATAVQAARVRGKYQDGRRYFVWMSCDAGLVLPPDAPESARDELARLVARRQRG